MRRSSWPRIVFILLLTLAVWSSRAADYLLFHAIVESLAVLIAGGIFVLAWNMRRYVNHGFYAFLGSAWLFVAIIDFTHTLSYKGMGLFPDMAPNLPTQLWVTARFLQAVSFIAAFRFLHRRCDSPFYLFVWAIITSIALALIFTGYFPDCFVPGEGLTPFKKIVEIIVILLFIIGAWLVWRNRFFFPTESWACLLTALALGVVSEGFFIFYAKVEDIWNELGHVFKLLSFLLVYQAVVVSGITRSFHDYFQELNEIGWLLQKEGKPPESPASSTRGKPYHFCRQESEWHEIIGAPMLEEMATSFLDLLETTVLVHDHEGRCVFAGYASPWYNVLESKGKLSFLDAGETRPSESPFAHSPWLQGVQKAIAENRSQDIEDIGDLRAYLVPVMLGSEVFGVIGIGYGPVPKKRADIEMAAHNWNVKLAKVSAWVSGYHFRPPYMITFAQRRLQMFANWMGEITLRHRIEKERDEGARLFETIATTSPVAITRLDREGRIVYANPFAHQLLKIQEPELGKRTFDSPQWVIRDLEGNPIAPEALPFSIVKGTGESIEGFRHSIMNPETGQEIFLSINATPLFDNEGNFDGMLSALVDISRLRENESKIEELNRELHQRLDMQTKAVLDTNALLERIFSITHVLLASLDANLRFTRVNRAFCDLFEKPRDYFAARSFADFWPSRRTSEAITYTEKNREPAYMDNDVIRAGEANRKLCYIDWSLVPSVNQEGEITAFVLSCIDITRRFRAESVVSEKEEKIEQLEKEILLLGDISKSSSPSENRKTKPLRDRAPAIIERFTEKYNAIIDLSIDQKTYKVNHNVSELLLELAENFGQMQADPRDLIVMHGNALRNLSRNMESREKLNAYLDESRMLLLELMGHLANFYRSHLDPGSSSNGER
ncbi:MAG: MASE3 domain-containing protein [Candidatus Sumerlaeia bacterium]